MTPALKAPFPWFGGKSRVADVVWRAFGNVPNYVEPFAGSLAVLLGRPHEPKIETVNDLDCLAPETRILRADMSWARASDICVGDRLLAFDEQNGPATGPGLRAPSRYRRFAHATVLGVRRIVKPCYRLTFDDGTVVTASKDHLWLGGSHKSGGNGGGRGWRWLKTSSLVCNRATQRSWVLKVCDVIEREESFDAGWVSGLLDGEGSVVVGPGLRISVSQNEGAILDRAEALLTGRGMSVSKSSGDRRCKQLLATGGKHEQLAILMRFRPGRLIKNFLEQCDEVSLYGREHRAVGLVSKEFLGDREVMAIETDAKTYIAEGLASHNCYLANFWRAVQADPEAVAAVADWPVNEADLHARHLWLVNRAEFRERMKVDPSFFDVDVAGRWVWGLSLWIGTGWCAIRGRGDGRPSQQLPHLGTAGMGVHRQLPHLGNAGRGVHRQLPHLGNAGRGECLRDYLAAIADRLRDVRVACGDWKRVTGDSVTFKHGVSGVFLDPPYDDGEADYSAGGAGISADVRAWAIENGANRQLRVALCGYDGEHAMPGDWAVHAWKAKGGYGNQSHGANENARRERIWFSPHCLPLVAKQVSLFGETGT